MDELAYHVAITNASSSATRKLYAFPQSAHSYNREQNHLATLGLHRLKRLSRGCVCYFFISFKDGSETQGVFRVLNLHDVKVENADTDPRAHPASLRAECALIESETQGEAASWHEAKDVSKPIVVDSSHVQSIGFMGPCIPIELSHAKQIEDTKVLNLSAAQADAAWTQFCGKAKKDSDALGGEHAKRLCKTYKNGPSQLLDDARVFGDDRPIFLGMLLNGVHGMWKARLKMPTSDMHKLNTDGVTAQHWESGVAFDDYVRMTGCGTCPTILANDTRVRLFFVNQVWLLESYGSLRHPVVPREEWQKLLHTHTADASDHEHVVSVLLSGLKEVDGELLRVRIPPHGERADETTVFYQNRLCTVRPSGWRLQLERVTNQAYVHHAPTADQDDPLSPVISGGTPTEASGDTLTAVDNASEDMDTKSPPAANEIVPIVVDNASEDMETETQEKSNHASSSPALAAQDAAVEMDVQQDAAHEFATFAATPPDSHMAHVNPEMAGDTLQNSKEHEIKKHIKNSRAASERRPRRMRQNDSSRANLILQKRGIEGDQSDVYEPGASAHQGTGAPNGNENDHKNNGNGTPEGSANGASSNTDKVVNHQKSEEAYVHHTPTADQDDPLGPVVSGGGTPQNSGETSIVGTQDGAAQGSANGATANSPHTDVDIGNALQKYVSGASGAMHGHGASSNHEHGEGASSEGIDSISMIVDTYTPQPNTGGAGGENEGNVSSPGNHITPQGNTGAEGGENGGNTVASEQNHVFIFTAGGNTSEEKSKSPKPTLSFEENITKKKKKSPKPQSEDQTPIANAAEVPHGGGHGTDAHEHGSGEQATQSGNDSTSQINTGAAGGENGGKPTTSQKGNTVASDKPQIQGKKFPKRTLSFEGNNFKPNNMKKSRMDNKYNNENESPKPKSEDQTSIANAYTHTGDDTGEGYGGPSDAVIQMEHDAGEKGESYAAMEIVEKATGSNGTPENVNASSSENEEHRVSGNANGATSNSPPTKSGSESARRAFARSERRHVPERQHEHLRRFDTWHRERSHSRSRSPSRSRERLA